MKPLITPEGVRTLLRAPDVIIIDARGGPDATGRYATGHLEGALYVNLESDLSEIRDPANGGRHPLPDAQRFGYLLGQLGIRPASHVLVYDDKAGANAAARFWWMMRAAGHAHIQVIDGGFDAIRSAGLQIGTGPSPERHEAADPYPVSTWALPLADIDLIDDFRVRGDALVIDVREGYRYRGESEPIDEVAGHIPGAINVPYIDNLTTDGKFRSPAALSQTYTAVVGDRPADQVAIHCGSGVTACHTILAMEVAGIPIPRLYIGSWSEWSRNNRPVATEGGTEDV